eukprot:CAMPEP_0170529690 /NCGR_PEP_ID=MMETSP0209-20121228/27810_1 /TAXON_ID=665100 ORGANISM="Litonotus pictus, Strain P1" /NCGR_SAMPLE_ID=MMETSP0209 /ASSEMBLY_ACC=CAM_ASM_000301 /LENGTH=94 /DNA_ID=CAMNT_0010821957 /DNA_START=384 /DNA_END=664 /DNA_ORIENTATION=+
MAGEETVRRLIMYSMGASSGLLLMSRNDGYYVKSDAIIRGFIYYVVFKNPQTSFYLFPLPFQIKAMYIGVIMATIDVLSGKTCNFGGAIAAMAL